MRRAQPDTPLVRSYWDKTNAYALNDPDVRLMVVIDKSCQPECIVTLGRFTTPPSDPSKAQILDAGAWSQVPLTVDHDAAMCNAFIDFIVLCRQTAMTGTKHYFIELLATSHEYKGSGAGRLLMDWLCAEADRNAAAVFVETNTDIVKFYQRFGFDVFERLIMPGEYKYEEWVLVRPA